jgi:hypothetical protein
MTALENIAACYVAVQAARLALDVANDRARDANAQRMASAAEKVATSAFSTREPGYSIPRTEPESE